MDREWFMNPLNLIILGPQGSGKTTQAELLAQTFGLVLLGAGDVLREVAQEETELGRRVRQTIDLEGRLLEPDLITEIMKERINAVPQSRGLILDGYPRTVTQYEMFRKFWPETGRGDYHAIVIDVPEDEAIRRLSKRVTCENCNADYIEGTFKKCTKCGGRLIKRPDDTSTIIKTRLQSFYSETVPMIRAMELEGKVLHVDGTLPVDEVHRTIAERLRQEENLNLEFRRQ
jgi:adenylate kinase